MRNLPEMPGSPSAQDVEKNGETRHEEPASNHIKIYANNKHVRGTEDQQSQRAGAYTLSLSKSQ